MVRERDVHISDMWHTVMREAPQSLIKGINLCVFRALSYTPVLILTVIGHDATW